MENFLTKILEILKSLEESQQNYLEKNKYDFHTSLNLYKIDH